MRSMEISEIIVKLFEEGCNADSKTGPFSMKYLRWSNNLQIMVHFFQGLKNKMIVMMQKIFPQFKIQKQQMYKQQMINES